jgi:hypothetical protein
MAKLQKFNTPPPATARTPQDFANIPPPPSGLAPTQNDHSVEAPAPAPVATSEQSNPQLDTLARKERQLRKAQQEFKAAQEAWKRDQANYVPKTRLTSETLAVLAEAGISPDKLFELQLNQAPQDPNTALQQKIATLESRIQELTDPEKGYFAQRENQEYQAAVKVIRDDATLLVESNPTYGTIKSEGQTEEVVNLITRCFDEEGVTLSVEEAAQLVEDKLVERLTKQFERLNKLDKFKTRFGQPAENLAEASTPQQPAPKRVNTLTNAGSTTHQLTPRERAILRVQDNIDAAKRK